MDRFPQMASEPTKFQFSSLASDPSGRVEHMALPRQCLIEAGKTGRLAWSTRRGSAASGAGGSDIGKAEPGGG